MDFEGIIRSEISQAEKEVLYALTNTWNFKQPNS